MDNCKKIIAIASVSAFLTACGGGGSSSSSSSGGYSAANLQTGVFIDSKVTGLTFTTPTQEGTTQNGEFSYLEGEDVEFRLGEIILGKARGNSKLTPYDLTDNYRAITIAQLLQSLDINNNPDDGIDLTHIVKANTAGQTIEVALDQATIDVISGSTNQYTLLSRNSAQRHLDAYALNRVSIQNGSALLSANIPQEWFSNSIYRASTRYGHYNPDLNDFSYLAADLTLLDGYEVGDGIASHRIRIFGQSGDKSQEVIVGVGLRIVNGQLKPSAYAVACNLLASPTQCYDASVLSEDSGFYNDIELNKPYRAEITRVGNSLDTIKVTLNKKSIYFDVQALVNEYNVSGLKYITAHADTKITTQSVPGKVSGLVDNFLLETTSGTVINEDFSSGEFDNSSVNYINTRYYQ